jgi:hypothetical protein
MPPVYAKIMPKVLLSLGQHPVSRTTSLARAGPQARMKNLQNRLGFAVTLARLAGGNDSLRQPEQALAESKLAKEDSFCKDLNESERRWLREHSSVQARQWNLLSDLRPDLLRYV